MTARDAIPPGWVLIRQDEYAPAGRPPKGSVWLRGPQGIATTIYTDAAEAIAAAWELDARWTAQRATAGAAQQMELF